MVGVAILGYGVVGSGVAEMLIKNGEMISRATGQTLALRYVVDIRKLDVPEGVTLTERFDDVLNADDVRIVVETIGGAKVAYEFTRRALESGRSVVTSNKELVAERGDELIALAEAHGAMYLYEASVGGGIPVLRPIMQCLSGNRITAITGIVNGSTNYLLTRMADMGVSFSAALGEAKKLGYVEGNPAADIEGWDARRKLAILANAAFGSKLTDDVMIPTEGISAITERDIEAAGMFGASVKLIAHAELLENTWFGWVHPAAVMKESLIHDVNDVFNGIMVHGDCVGDVMFYGRGAGSLPTASAVIGDIIDVAQHLDAPKKRIRFVSTPGFKLVQDNEIQLLTWMIAEEEALQKLRTHMRGVMLRQKDNLCAIFTPKMPYRQTMNVFSSLSAEGVRFGAMLNVIR